MKKLFSIACAVFIISVFTAQEKSYKNISFGEQYKKGLKTSFFDFKPIGYSQKGTIGYLMPYSAVSPSAVGSTKNYRICLVNEELRISKETEINLEIDGKERSFIELFMLNDKIYLISSYQNQNDKKHYLFSETFNKETLEQNNDIKKIAEISYEESNKYNTLSTGVNFSPDSTKIHLHYTLLNNNSLVKNFSFTVFNQDFTPYWMYDKETNFLSDSLYLSINSVVSNNGDVHYLYQTFKDNDERGNHFLSLYANRSKDQKMRYEYKVISFLKSRDTPIERTIHLGDNNFIRETSIYATDKNVVCLGLLSDNQKLTLSGAYSVVFSSNSVDKISQKTIAFPAEAILAENLDKADIKAKDKFFYLPEKIIQRKDGGFYFLAEQTWKQQENQGNYISTVFRVNNILIVSFNSSGIPEWTQKILKRQYAEDFSSLSFKPLLYGESLYVIYSEFSKKNYGLSALKDSKMFVAKISKDGNITVSQFGSTKEQDCVIKTYSTSWFNNNSVLLYGEGGLGGKYKFAKIDL
ncbi:MAG: hypothetical protein ACLGGV_01030 [Bacteroidia bacterium]